MGDLPVSMLILVALFGVSMLTVFFEWFCYFRFVPGYFRLGSRPLDITLELPQHPPFEQLQGTSLHGTWRPADGVLLMRRKLGLGRHAYVKLVIARGPRGRAVVRWSMLGHALWLVPAVLAQFQYLIWQETGIWAFPGGIMLAIWPLVMWGNHIGGKREASKLIEELGAALG